MWLANCAPTTRREHASAISSNAINAWPYIWHRFTNMIIKYVKLFIKFEYRNSTFFINIISLINVQGNYAYDDNYHMFHSMNGFDYKEEFFCHPSSDVAKRAEYIFIQNIKSNLIFQKSLILFSLIFS